MDRLPIELIEHIVLYLDPIMAIYFDKYLSNHVKRQIYRDIKLKKLNTNSYFILDIIIPYLGKRKQKYISKYFTLPESFIIKHVDKLHWISISKSQQLTNKCIELFIDKTWLSRSTI
jgi:hypothetical protein